MPLVSKVGARTLVIAVLATAPSCTDRSAQSGMCVEGEQVQCGCNSCTCAGEFWACGGAVCSYALGEQVACYPHGVADAEPEIAGVQVNCSVTQVRMVDGGAEDSSVPLCVRTESGYALPSPDVDLCYFVRTDTTGAGDPLDDVSPACVEVGGEQHAAEFEFLLPPGFSWETTTFSATCQEFPDCPPVDTGG